MLIFDRALRRPVQSVLEVIFLLMLAALSFDAAAVLPEEKKKPAVKPPPAPIDTGFRATAGKTFTWTTDGEKEAGGGCTTVVGKSNTYVFDSTGKQARRTSTGTNIRAEFDGGAADVLREAESKLSDARKERNPYSSPKAQDRWDSRKREEIADLQSRVDELRKRLSEQRAACENLKGKTYRTVRSVSYDPTANKAVEIIIEDSDNEVGQRNDAIIELVEDGKFLRVINISPDGSNRSAPRLYRAQ